MCGPALVNRRKDGRLYDDERTTVPIRGDAGTIIGVVSMGEGSSGVLQNDRERVALIRANLAATGVLDLPVALQVVLQSALEATAADGGVVMFVGRTKEEFGRSVCVGVLTDDAYAKASLEAIEQLGIRQQERISVRSGHRLEGPHDLRSVAVLPLRARGEVLGVAAVVARRPDAFPDRVRPVVEAFASQASVMVENALLHRDVQRMIKVLEALGQLTRTLRGAQGLDELLRLLVEEATRALSATSAAVLLLDVSQTFLSVRVSRGACTVMKGSFPLGESLLGLPLRLGHLLIADQADIESFAQATGVSGLCTLALIPLSTSAGHVGVAVLGRQQPVAFSRADLDLIAILGDVASTAIHRVRLREELEEAYIGATFALAEAVEARDSYATGHAQRTGSLAEQVARMMDLPEDQVQDIRYGAILHDVGKLSVSEGILRKTGPLNAEEWEVIRRHPIAGVRILSHVSKLARAAEIVRHHHERWDGSGYPDGLRGEAIPLGGRIVAVVDAYTAMVDKRTYRKARSQDEALEELQRHAGTQFDPAVVAAFLRVVRMGEYL